MSDFDLSASDESEASDTAPDAAEAVDEIPDDIPETPDDNPDAGQVEPITTILDEDAADLAPPEDPNDKTGLKIRPSGPEGQPSEEGEPLTKPHTPEAPSPTWFEDEISNAR